ncbi:MAG: hypothetical protein JRG92_00700 [Deltaproteobacteria bacterium]|nr:hypothetical protein [Deltaproteobacteria bacterium]MBW2382113.1 hypothetical protein [Deltaproteobacteria bacterium]
MARRSQPRLRGRMAHLLGLAEESPKRRGRGRGKAGRKSQRNQPSGLSLGIIGIDVGHTRVRLSVQRLLLVLALTLLVALGVASLRIEMIRLRYALAETSLEEERLLEEQRSLTAEKLRLRDPVHLAGRARELGFVRPERLIDLPAVALGPDQRARTVLASVGAETPASLGRP